MFLRQAQDRLTLRRTVQVRLGTNTLWLPGGTPIFVVSRQQFMKYPGESEFIEDIRLTADMRISTFVLGGFLSLGTMPKNMGEENLVISVIL